MSSIENYQTLEIELTSHCNVRCPGCSRTKDGETHPGLSLDTISYEKFIERVPPHVLKGKFITYCGSFGEPLMHKDFLKIAKYSIDCGAKVSLDTNASLRTTDWWRELGSLSDKIYVRFSVDGHRETNHLYRVRAKFDKILENMKAYSEAGGSGEWKYIIFQHNEHEVEIAKNEAEKLGFEFSTQRNRRVPDKSWPTYKEIETKTKVNEKRKILIEKKQDFVQSDLIEIMQQKTPTPRKKKKIVCWMLDNVGLFLGSDGKVWPCCFFYSTYKEYTFLPVDIQQSMIKEKDTGKYLHYLDEYYGENWNNIYHKTWEQILDNNFYKKYLLDSLKNNPFNACTHNCTKSV